MAKADLIARIDELTRANNELGTTTEQYRRNNDTLHARITELEDDLAAVRWSLSRLPAAAGVGAGTRRPRRPAAARRGGGRPPGNA
jgi:hypothetical protein